MTEIISNMQAFRYSRHLMLPAMDFRGQEALLNSKVLLVGMGGLGCAAAPYLVASGIGKLTLVDDDTIDYSNLQRQILYREQDVGQSKVETALRQLQQLNSEIQLDALKQRLDVATLTALVPAYSMVLDCTDNLATRNAINQACVQANIPLVSAAAIRFEGQLLSLRNAPNDPCYHCLSQLFGERQLSCMEAGILSPVVGVIGVMQALAAVKILAQVGDAEYHQLKLFDGLTGQWQAFTLQKAANCPVCGTASA
ncbi:HesA/MoeB/ThiF family protein [Alishewanella longhuensis]